jgi:gliding motility-associated-like protein
LSNDYIQIANGWFAIVDDEFLTPDYCNSCNNSLSGVVGVPSNIWGWQNAFHGNAYVGIAIDLNVDFPMGAKEFVQCRLQKPLIKCGNYSLSYFVSLSEFSTGTFSRLGALFSEDTLKSNFGSINGLIPTIINSTGFILDSIDWVRISSNFTAEEKASFLTIGHFGTLSTDTLYLKPPLPPNTHLYSYFYVDSVTLTLNSIDFDCLTSNFPNVFTPNNDGINDYFIYDIGDLTELNFKIFNRWGQCLYSANEINWDGNFNSGECAEGVYYYLIEIEINNIKYHHSGTINLIR